MKVLKFIIILIISIVVTNGCYGSSDDFINKSNIKKIIFFRNFVALIIAAITWKTTYFINVEWTVYERSLVCYVVINALNFVLCIFNRIEKEKQILKFFLWIALGIVSYSIMTRGQTLIDSDTATATFLAQAQIEYRQLFPKSWCYANGDLWVLTSNLCTMPFTLLLHNQSIARMLGSLTLVLLVSLVIFCVSKKFFKNDSWIISIPIFILGTFGKYDMILFQVGYTSQMMWILLTVWLFYETIFNNSRLKLLLFSVLLTILITSGIRYIAEIVVPLFGATLLVIYIDDWRNANNAICKKIIKTTKVFMVLIIPTLFGNVFYNRICMTHFMNNTDKNSIIFADSLDKCWDNLISLFLNCFVIFGYRGNVELVSMVGVRNIISLCVTIVVMFIIPIIQLKTILKESKNVRFFYCFALIHNLEMAIMAILFDHVDDRYYLTSVFVCEIVATVFLFNHKKECNNKIYHFTTLGVGLIVIIYGIVLVDYSTGWRDELDSKKEMCDVLVSHGLRKGYATYWNACNNEIYSDFRLKIVAMNIIVEGSDPNRQYWWLVDSNRFKPEKVKNSFLLLDKQENEYAKEKIIDIYGLPNETFTLRNDEYFVYVWDYDISQRQINGLADYELNVNEIYENDTISKKDGVVYLKKTGKIEYDNTFMNKGNYKILFDGEKLDKTRVDIFTEYNQDSDFQINEISKSGKKIVIDITLKKKIRKIWFRLYNGSEEDIKFKKMKIERTNL